jgi:hypothetical protein
MPVAGCPNINDPLNASLIKELGIKEFYRLWLKFEGDIPREVVNYVLEKPDPVYSQDDNIHEEFGFKDQPAKIKDIRDLADLLHKKTGTFRTYSSFSKEELVNRIFNNINPKTMSYNYYDTEFDFTGMSDSEIKQIIREKVVPLFTEFETKHKAKFVKWLNEGADYDTLQVYFPGKIKGESRYSNNTINNMLRYIDYTPGTRYIQYSDLKSSEFQGLGIVYREGFEGYNPIIAIHNSTQGNPSISIFDTTSMGLSREGLEIGYLLSAFESNEELELKGMKYSNREGSIRKFLIGMTTMALKEANPNLSIRKSAVISIHGREANPSFVLMDSSDFLAEAKGASQVKKFMDLLPANMQEMLKNEVLYKSSYGQDTLSVLKEWLDTNYVQKNNTDSRLGSGYFWAQNAVDEIDKQLNGEGSVEDLIDIIQNRQRILENTLSSEALYSNQEYTRLAAALRQLTEKKSFEKNDVKDMTQAQMNYTNSHNIENDILQWAKDIVLNAQNLIVEKLRNVQKKNVEFVKKIEDVFFLKSGNVIAEKIKDRVSDTGGKRFEKMFKKSIVKDAKSGGLMQVYNGEIHWDENDPDTKKAILNGDITKEHVAYGKFLMDTFEDMYLRQYVHENRFRYRENGKFNETKAMADAKKWLPKRWKKGRVPIVSRSVAELILSGNLDNTKRGFRNFLYKMSNSDRIFEEEFKEFGKANFEVSNSFLSELGDESDFGSDFKLERMGLALADPTTKEIVVVDAEKNKSISTNLELIFNYFMLAGERKIIFEKKALPAVNSARALLSTLNGTPQQQANNLKWLQIFSDRIIHGKTQPNQAGVVDPWINTMVALTTFNGLALNPFVASTSFVINTAQLYTTAMANSLGGTNYYGYKEANKAVALFHTPAGYKKMRALMEFYKVADMGEHEIANSPLWLQTNKNFFQSHYMHKMNWLTDYNIRGIVMMAQMIKDGSFDAHEVNKEGNIIYNIKKDKRFYVAGKLTDEGKAKLDFMKKLMVQQGILENEKDDIKRGYDYDSARLFKWLSDKYIVGGIDPTTQTAMQSYTFGKLFNQFKQYLPDKVYNYIGKRAYSTAGGQIVYKNGMAVWEKAEIEGIFRSILSGVKELRSAHKQGLTYGEAWKNLSAVKKRNYVKLAADIAMFSILYGLYAGLTADWDDDDEEAFLKDSRFLRVFKFGALDMLTFAPNNFLWSVSNPFPAVDQALRIWNVVMGDTRELERTVPLGTTIKEFGDLVEE